MATIATDPASGSIIHIESAVNITCDEAPESTSTGYDPDIYPSSPAVLYYFKASKSGSDDLISEIFATNDDGTHTWPSVIFPAAGSWTVDLVDSADDSVAASTSVTVS